MPTIDVGGEPFEVLVEGNEAAPPLMLSNSLGTNLHMWDEQAAEWRGRFRVIRYDSRGHGRSAAPRRPTSIAELGRDALAIMDRLGVPRTHWCGLSKGGMVGQWLLVNAPQRLHRTVLANTAASMGPPEIWNGRIRAIAAGGMGAHAQAILERWFTPEFRAGPGSALERVRGMISTTPAHGYTSCCAAIRDMDQREAIRAARGETLVIVGQRDPATPPEAGRLIASRIPGARLLELDAAHLSNVEQPEAFTRAVEAFLAG